MVSFTRFCIELYKLTMNELGTFEKRSSTIFSRLSGSVTIDFICFFIQAHMLLIGLKRELYAGQCFLSAPLS